MTREEASKVIKDGLEDMSLDFADEEQYEALTMAIKALQEPKTGHWIEKDGFDGDVYYDCSECGESWTTIEGTPWQNGMSYCPNCGCRMIPPQESEG